RGAVQNVATFRVATEIEVAFRKQRVRVERELVALLRFLTDGEEPNGRLLDVEDLLGEDRAHDTELEEVLRATVRVCADIDEDRRPVRGTNRDGERGTAHTRQAADHDEPGGEHRARVP